MLATVIDKTMVAYLGNEDNANITNPIHSTEVAKAYGFNGAVVAGVTVWGWATDTILEALGEEWLAYGWAEYLFRQPVYPGDVLAIRATLDTGTKPVSWSVEITNQSMVLCVLGKVGLGKAIWSREFNHTKLMVPDIDPTCRGSLTLENAEIGVDWNPMMVKFTRELAREFISHKQLTDHPLFVGDRPIAHPSWIAGWAEQLLRHNFDIPISMHTRSLVQHHQRVGLNAGVVGGATLINVYQRKAHHFATFDVLLQDQDGAHIAELRHWTIFRVGTVSERGKT